MKYLPESLFRPRISTQSEAISPGMAIMVMLMVVIPRFALFKAASAIAVASVRLSAGSLHSRILSPPPAVTVKVLFLSLLVYWYFTPV